MDGAGLLTRTTIGVEVRPHAVRVRMQGDLDAGVAPRLERVLTQMISDAADPPAAARMTIDLEAVDVIAAAGITVLLRTTELAVDRGLRCVVCVNPRGRRALALTGLDHVLLARRSP